MNLMITDSDRSGGRLSEELSGAVSVDLEALVDIAIDNWRLAQWAFASGHEKERVVARQACRGLSSFLDAVGFEIRDLAGQVYDPGLTVDVVDTENVPETGAGAARIIETIVPIVLLRGRIVRTGQVVIGSGEVSE